MGRAERPAQLLLSALGMHHDATAFHCVRVAALARVVAHSYRALWLQDDLNALILGALLHDIGKLAVPTCILDKAGCLTPADWPIIRAHPVKGASLCAMIPELGQAIPSVRHHHERWDGAGYPNKLSGHSIPLHARIVAVCDTYDAITHDRPYREARGHAAACEILETMAGVGFDPDVVYALTGLGEAQL